MNTVDWLAKLIAYDTTSHHSNLALINTIHDWFEKHDVKTRLTYDKDKQKANLFATLPDKQGSTQGGIVLSGHTDVVPVKDQVWDTPPFQAVQIEDKVYGRGAADMKGFLAVILALLPEFKKQALSSPLHFAFSYDEEVGCHGARVLLEDLQKAAIHPNACIVGEPTEMQPVIAHKGIMLFRCRVQGRAAHSSLTPQGCNAIEYAAKLICRLREWADEFKQQGPFDADFDVPFTSLSTNRILGGIANNIIPETCEFTFECRYLPEIQSQEIIKKVENFIKNVLQPAMQAEFSDAYIEMTPVACVPAFFTDKTTIIEQFLTMSKKDKIRKVAYATEAGLFQGANIPTIVCGPGSIEQAHRPNEYIAIDQLKQCENFFRKLVINS